MSNALFSVESLLLAREGGGGGEGGHVEVLIDEEYAGAVRDLASGCPSLPFGFIVSRLVPEGVIDKVLLMLGRMLDTRSNFFGESEVDLMTDDLFSRVLGSIEF